MWMAAVWGSNCISVAMFTYGIGMGVSSWDVSAGVGSIGAVT